MAVSRGRAMALAVIVVMTSVLATAPDAAARAPEVARGLPATELSVPQPPSGLGATSTDSFRPASWIGPSSASYAKAGRVVCTGDGTSGNRIQAVYLAVPGRASLASVTASITQAARLADAAFAVTSSREGGSRHIRWVTKPTGSACGLSITSVRVSATVAGDLEATAAALRAAGMDSIDRIYEVWSPVPAADPSLCGQGQEPVSDSPGPGNLANTGGRVTITWQPCWGMSRYTGGLSVEAHELTHALGAVQASAPHATLGGHCTDGADLMCYNDGSLPTYPRTLRCPLSYTPLLDCGADDYFAIGPPAGSYLATHWNVADSAFLIGSGPDVPSVDLVVAGLSPDPTGASTALGVVPVAIDVLASGWSDVTGVDLQRSVDGGATWTSVAIDVSHTTLQRRISLELADSVPPGTYVWRVRARDTNGGWSAWSLSNTLGLTQPGASFWAGTTSVMENPAGTTARLSGSLLAGGADGCRVRYRIVGQPWRTSPSSACSIDDSGTVTITILIAHGAPGGIAWQATLTRTGTSGPGDTYGGVLWVASAS